MFISYNHANQLWMGRKYHTNHPAKIATVFQKSNFTNMHASKPLLLTRDCVMLKAFMYISLLYITASIYLIPNKYRFTNGNEHPYTPVEYSHFTFVVLIT